MWDTALEAANRLEALRQCLRVEAGKSGSNPFILAAADRHTQIWRKIKEKKRHDGLGLTWKMSESLREEKKPRMNDACRNG